MTHRSTLPAASIPWEDCDVVRFSGNNGIVLMHVGRSSFNEVLFFISGSDIGIYPEDTPEAAIECATPLFKVLLETHNAAIGAGYQRGYAEAKAEIRKALGV